MVLQINHLNKIGNKKCLGGTNLTNDLSILIRSILKITYYIILLYTFFNVTMLDCFSQSKDSHIKKFSFLVSSGLTLHTDGNIYKRDGGDRGCRRKCCSPPGEVLLYVLLQRPCGDSAAFTVFILMLDITSIYFHPGGKSQRQRFAKY